MRNRVGVVLGLLVCTSSTQAFHVYVNKQDSLAMLQRFAPNPIRNIVCIEKVYQFKAARLRASVMADLGILQLSDDGNEDETFFLIQQRGSEGYLIDCLCMTDRPRAIRQLRDWWDTVSLSPLLLAFSEMRDDWEAAY